MPTVSCFGDCITTCNTTKSCALPMWQINNCLNLHAIYIAVRSMLVVLQPSL